MRVMGNWRVDNGTSKDSVMKGSACSCLYHFPVCPDCSLIIERPFSYEIFTISSHLFSTVSHLSSYRHPEVQIDFNLTVHPIVYNLIPLARFPEITNESLLAENEDRQRLAGDIWDALGIAAAALRSLILLCR